MDIFPGTCNTRSLLFDLINTPNPYRPSNYRHSVTSDAHLPTHYIHSLPCFASKGKICDKDAVAKVTERMVLRLPVLSMQPDCIFQENAHRQAVMHTEYFAQPTGLLAVLDQTNKYKLMQLCP